MIGLKRGALNIIKSIKFEFYQLRFSPLYFATQNLNIFIVIFIVILCFIYFIFELIFNLRMASQRFGIVRKVKIWKLASVQSVLLFIRNKQHNLSWDRYGKCNKNAFYSMRR